MGMSIGNQLMGNQFAAQTILFHGLKIQSRAIHAHAICDVLDTVISMGSSQRPL